MGSCCRDLSVLFRKDCGQSLELCAGKATEYLALNELFCWSLRKKLLGAMSAPGSCLPALVSLSDEISSLLPRLLLVVVFIIAMESKLRQCVRFVYT